MKEITVLKFENLKPHPDAQLRITQENGQYHLHLSCHCTITNSLPESLYLEAMFWLQTVCGGKFIKLEESHWKNPDYKATSHVFCKKDHLQIRKIVLLVDERKAIWMRNPTATPFELGNDLFWKVMFKALFTGPGPCFKSFFKSAINEFLLTPQDFVDALDYLCEDSNILEHLQRTSSPTIHHQKKPKKTQGLPTSVKEALQKANNEKLQTIDQVEPDDTNKQSKNKKNKKSKKKPNQGKAPNNIRKTKKPTKL
ncbi:Oidioi.mRNA.OKI2018_I69.XSR.g16099.t1.cds [Oikopleura dioica]|uniref:Oidioi.mRNA.OKI2018_I69.XSR.g16099.t1.cds n=1 Tax=Oikopleura dioica TaxID=34765 RepID=A0ABN7SGV1_OIKDI|nr:Oidioi.mRNA.OKI2018_I69.XSR.g16099.t1.cds [Oikopleura dioica]